ncbi:MAG: hypothetical protein AAF986_03915, partial [Pseudomonadota bacterium]
CEIASQYLIFLDSELFCYVFVNASAAFLAVCKALMEYFCDKTLRSASSAYLAMLRQLIWYHFVTSPEGACVFCMQGTCGDGWCCILFAVFRLALLLPANH